MFQRLTRFFRNEVKFLAQLDLDEMLYVGPKRSVIEFMRAIDLQEPEMAAVSFRSQRVQVLVSFLRGSKRPYKNDKQKMLRL